MGRPVLLVPRRLVRSVKGVWRHEWVANAASRRMKSAESFLGPENCMYHTEIQSESKTAI